MKVITEYKDGHVDNEVVDCGCKLPRIMKDRIRNREQINVIHITEL